mgnify:CR=1 FL=1
MTLFILPAQPPTAAAAATAAATAAAAAATAATATAGGSSNSSSSQVPAAAFPARPQRPWHDPRLAVLDPDAASGGSLSVEVVEGVAVWPRLTVRGWVGAYVLVFRAVSQEDAALYQVGWEGWGGRWDGVGCKDQPEPNAVGGGVGERL